MELSITHRSLIHSNFSHSCLRNSSIRLSHRLLLPAHLPQRKVHLLSIHLPPYSMDPKVPRASDNNGSPVVSTAQGGRIGEVKRVTKETNVSVKINLDGDVVAENNTCIPFLDHVLDQLASHGLFDVHVKAFGDIHIDDHHTNEDVALAIETAMLQALGYRK